MPFTFSRKPGPAVVVALEPSLPLGATVVGVTVDGRQAPDRVVATPHDVSPSLEVTVTGATEVEIRHRGGAELVPQQTRPMPGDRSRGLRLLDWRAEGGRFVATVEGSGEQRFRVRSAESLRVAEGGQVVDRAGAFSTIRWSSAPPASGGRWCCCPEVWPGGTAVGFRSGPRVPGA